MTKADYYETLGISRNSSEQEIKQAYRRLAMKHHPDRNAHDHASEEKFKQVQEAYDVLSDSKKRHMYDQFGFYAENYQGGPPPGQRPAATPGTRPPGTALRGTCGPACLDHTRAIRGTSSTGRAAGPRSSPGRRRP